MAFSLFLRAVDRWQKKKDTVVPAARLMRVVIVQRGPADDARLDTYSIVFKTQAGDQFAINCMGDEAGLLVQAICQAERP